MVKKIFRYYKIFFAAGIFAIMATVFLQDLFLIGISFLTIISIGILTLIYHKNLLIAVGSIGVGLILGGSIGALEVQDTSRKQLEIESYIGSYTVQEAVVKQIYKRKEYYDVYEVEIVSLLDQKISEDIYATLRVPKNFTLERGEHIFYSGKIYPFSDFNGFSYANYMHSKEIYFSSSTTSFERGEEKSSSFLGYFDSYRLKLLAGISRIFPEKEAIFLGGILFGARENIPAELSEDFNNSGLTHFIAVSGFNITLCVIFTTFIFGFFPKYIRIVLVAVSIISFTFFVGLGAPVVRAAIMGIIGYLFIQEGNTSSSTGLLLFTALCMGIYSPYSLLYDVSLHLSFLAVIGIVYTQDFFTKIFHFIPKTLAIQEAFVLTLSALSFSLPIMIFQFGQVSILAPIANILVTWTIPLAMLLGSLTLIAGSISDILGSLVGFPTWILLHYDMMIVEIFGNYEFSVLRYDFGVYKNYLLILYLIILGYIVSLYTLKKQVRVMH